MVTWIDESWEGGAVGTAPSAANSAFSSYAGATTTRAFTADGLFGQCCTLTADAANPAYAQYIATPSSAALYGRWYINTAHAGDATAGQVIIAGALLGTSYRSQITYGIANGIIGIRQGSVLKKSTVSEYLNQWIRLEWDQTSPTGTTGVQTLRIYAGANLHTATPTETLTDAVSAGQIDRIRLGFVTISGNVNTMKMDAAKFDTVSQPGPLPDPTPPPGGPAPYVWDGSAWVKKNTISVWDGSAWVDKTTITVY